MSRRPPPDRAAQNQTAIKNLLKLEYNKICADCKRNKHPRWASWNLGIFVCIRCSGIHRGMGTHVSRVKSVDLDAWTDEQLRSVLKWGNSRANKYWEAKLAPGHVPSEAKIENFIRTKYESKRWVMDGPMPDPSTLDGDDEVPLAIVQERAILERSTSQRIPQRTPSISSQPPVHRQQPPVDLFGDDEILTPPARPSTTDPPASHPPEKNPEPVAKQSKQADSLLGLEFFGSGQPSANNRPVGGISTPTSATGISRPDLKQSILSLYATAPRPQQATPQPGRSPSLGYTSQQPQSSNLGGLTDAFSGLSFPATTSSPQKQQDKPSPFSNLGSLGGTKSTLAAPKVTPSNNPLSGGRFLDKISSNVTPKPQGQVASESPKDHDISFSQKPSRLSKAPPPPPSSGDLFDLATPITTSPPKPKPASVPSVDPSSIFILSSQSAQPAQPMVTTTTNVSSMFSAANLDAWGSDAWSTPDPISASKAQSTTMKVPDTLTANDIGAGWGAAPTTNSKSTPTVVADEDFGGWTSAAPTSGQGTGKPGGGGFGGNDDLFSNVWE
ncbi:hypothetical protein V8E54_013592 [Elaphomyces granulatus]